MRIRLHLGDKDFGGLLVLEHRRGIIKSKRLDGAKPTDLEKFIGQYLLGFLFQHPCIGARALANKSEMKDDQIIPHQGLHYAVYPDMRSVSSAIMFLTDLENYYTRSDDIDPIIKTFAAIFVATDILSQEDFANKYWSFVQTVSDISSLTHDFGPITDVQAEDFELYLAGRAVFTTTLNSQSPRSARRFSYSTWVMNQTRQFDELRENGLFENWKTSIRKHDAGVDPSGVPNPILADHGTASAIGQLAGSMPQDFHFVVRKDRRDAIGACEWLLKRAEQENAPPAVIDELRARIRAAK